MSSPRDPNAARRAVRAAARQVLPVITKSFGIVRQHKIRMLVRAIRAHRGVTNTTNTNLSFKSKNLSASNMAIARKLHELLELMVQPLERDHKIPPLFSAHLFIRYRPNISSAYARQQTLHVNRMNNPLEGRAFAQFIYYIDTPQMNGRGNAPESERGGLLLNPVGSNRFNPANTSIITPQKGTIVYFPPDRVLHEVIQPTGNNAGNVSRNMVIGILYAPPRAGNTNYGERGVQIRPFQNAAGQPTSATRRYTNVVRTLAGVNRPAGAPHPGVNNNLAARLRGLALPTSKRKRSPTARNINPRPTKFYKLRK
jgi:hypothetical protein